ncbi:MAG: Sec-independent protein translocase subunit TatA/TatB [Pirellulales bacterium]|jgi:sec-independent protein translocase protein TatA|nr:twin-arginine translocase TatA/TatE family subunit [Mariniblastus sp.]|tara:strand:- start:383 stop:604 length:222 start_codon:yes stop_codon:yes gene_type:complete
MTGIVPLESLFLAFGMPGIPELLIIMAILLLLFGGAKLPGLMRNLGRSVNEFKTGIKEAPAESVIEDDSDSLD